MHKIPSGKVKSKKNAIFLKCLLKDVKNVSGVNGSFSYWMEKSSIMILKLLVFNIYGPLFNSSKILNPLLSEALILPFPLSMLTFYIQNHLQLEK